MPKLVLSNITSRGIQAINSNFQAISDYIDNLVSRDGDTPNQMEADLDLNNNDILNCKTFNTTDLYLNGDKITTSIGVIPDSSEIDVTPTGNLASTDVQSALEELQTDVNTLDTYITTVEITISGYPSFSSLVGNANEYVLVNAGETGYEYKTKTEVLTDLAVFDTTDNLTVGYTTDVETLGSNTITPDFQSENLKTRAVDGTVTINAPTTGNGVCFIKLDVDSSGPYTVISSLTPLGTWPVLDASTVYIAIVIRFGVGDAYLQITEAG